MDAFEEGYAFFEKQAGVPVKQARTNKVWKPELSMLQQVVVDTGFAPVCASVGVS